MPAQLPGNPKLRPLDVRRVQESGQPFFLLRDPLGLTEQQALVPEPLGLLLALCDGTRDCGAIASAFALRSGATLPPGFVERIVGQLSEALLLDDERYAQTKAAAVQAYRSAPFRPPALAGAVYPADPAGLSAAFQRYCQEAPPAPNGATPPDSGIVGVISPHIDYQRGWRVYAQAWREAKEAIAGAELVIVFGTDHAGGPGRLTLTRQHYATPWGVLPTARPIVDELALALGEDAAFAEELHHRKEHSVELALVWLHHFLRPRTCEVVPILCGSFHEFVLGQADPVSHDGFAKAIATLQRAAKSKRTVVVAAADLAHVGPAFGDAEPWGPAHRARLRTADEALLQTIAAGDPHGFFSQLRATGDCHRICGMPPIYLALRMLEGARGVTYGYDQCPADAQNASLVSIAGAILHQP